MKTEKDLDTMDLPKANYYEQLETLSEQNFQILFHPSKFHFCTRDRRDKGLDITYEIIRAENHIGFRFVVQLKSTESIEANKDDGSFSVPLDTPRSRGRIVREHENDKTQSNPMLKITVNARLLI
jgi:hypothetical protein